MPFIHPRPGLRCLQVSSPGTYPAAATCPAHLPLVCREYPAGKEHFRGKAWCPPPQFCYDQMEPISQVSGGAADAPATGS